VASVLVTGCNRGIGLEVCRQYRSRGDSVLGVCRQSNAELAALGIHVIDNIDVSNADDVTKLANTVGDEPIDILLNNAGIGGQDKLNTIDFDLMIQQYRINTLGPLRVTKALQNNLGDGSKVGIVTVALKRQPTWLASICITTCRPKELQSRCCTRVTLRPI
jgi:NAD(P)-dependent dehydrogenase (short-subunit alcohol dehydrogenase family)